MGFTAVLVLAKDEAGVLQGPLGGIFVSSVPFAYRVGGLNLLNGVVGDVMSEAVWVSIFSTRFTSRKKRTYTGGIARFWQG